MYPVVKIKHQRKTYFELLLDGSEVFSSFSLGSFRFFSGFSCVCQAFFLGLPPDPENSFDGLSCSFLSY